ncbi:protein of unknown function [Filimonas lacunae]|uniref:DUF3560 domain-containing protein n=1 Tax=Filimonas lacunae TaxID=477680 RepID=A0A173MA62_9BACT|nr:DUF3560 domain-containing protein [Filimonas lacunae]BAV04427.1 hypothetical protein FLA_0418 [Filimonas lacunae]SIT31411.1 protein of unknown function [Filimonas lacunae]
MRHDYHERKVNRADNAEMQAAKSRQKSQQLYESSHNMVSGIPMGQPILIGHHSEKGHRRLLERSNNAMRGSVEADKAADHYEDRASSIRNNKTIATDNPDALQLLRDKLARLQAAHELLKQAGKLYRKNPNDKDGYMKLPGATIGQWNDMVKYGGIKRFEIANSNQNINSVKKRLEEQEAIESLTYKEEEKNGVKYIINPEVGRVQLKFGSRVPEEVYRTLRKHGFVYCKSEGAFQRKITGNGVFAAKMFLKQFNP